MMVVVRSGRRGDRCWSQVFDFAKTIRQDLKVFAMSPQGFALAYGMNHSVTGRKTVLYDQ